MHQMVMVTAKSLWVHFTHNLPCEQAEAHPKKDRTTCLKFFFVNILVDSIVNIINGWVGVKKRKILHFDNTKRLAWTRAHDLQIT